MSDKSHHPHSEEPWSFLLHINNIRASSLTTRHRFKEKIRCKVIIERGDTGDKATTNKVYKTEWRPVGGDDIYWKFSQEHVLRVYFNRQSFERVAKWLKDHFIIFDCYCNHDSKSGKKAEGASYGAVKVSLFDCVTGAVNHHLPLLNVSGFALAFAFVKNF
jgi:hypothetical protein